MAHAADTVLALARTGVNMEVGEGYAASTLIEVARIVATTGAHAVIDVTHHAADTVRQVAEAGGKNVTVRV